MVGAETAAAETTDDADSAAPQPAVPAAEAELEAEPDSAKESEANRV